MRRGLASSGPLPGRRDIDATCIPQVLSYIWLIDYLAEERRLRYRLAGETVRAAYDQPVAGRCLDELIDGGAYPRVAWYFLDCLEKPAIVAMTGRLYHERAKPGYGERLLLPLFDGEGGPEGIVGATLCQSFFTNQEEAEHCANRTIHVMPLDGGEPMVEMS